MKSALLLLAFCLAAASRVHADTIYSTFDPDQSFLSSVGWPVVGPGADEFAASFVPTQNFTLDSIELAAVLVSGVPALNIEVAADNASSPGAAVEMLSTTDLSATPAVVTIDSLSHPLLLAKETYWVVLSSDVVNEVGWNWNDAEFVGVSLLMPGSSWFPLGTEVPTPAFAVFGTPTSTTIPEPASVWLLMAALAAGVGACRIPGIRSRLGSVRVTKSKLLQS